MIEIRQALNIIRRECGKAAQILPNRSMNNLVKNTLLIWTATNYDEEIQKSHQANEVITGEAI